MKKTVQIVTVPIDNKGFWNIGDIMKSPSGDRTWLINNTNFGETLCFWKPQQLLVLSDDEIQPGDWCTLLDSFGNVMLGNPQQYNPDLGHTLNDGLRKTIAAYPSLTGTLPLSKETIQEWIDNGTPGEGSVDVGKFYTGNYIHKCKTCNKEYIADKRWYRCKECSEKQLITDSQGNLILEFNRSLEEIMDSVFDKWEATNKIVTSHLEKAVKASTIPTDEEIEEKAENYINNNTPNRIPSESDNWNEADCHFAFLNGYKQALKDLGYSNEK